MKIIRKMIIAAMSLTVLGCSSVHIAANSQQANRDIDSVFGSVTIDEGAHVRNVSIVNGSITLKSNSRARDLDTVNGSIEIGENVRVNNAETVNGGIEADGRIDVHKSLVTVNGGIEIGSHGKVGTNVSTVNGDIQLVQVLVNGDIRTNNGDVRLKQGTQLKGDLIIEKSGGWFNGFSLGGYQQEVEIDSSSVVEGTIHLYKPVKLNIDAGASVGRIERHYSRQ